MTRRWLPGVARMLAGGPVPAAAAFFTVTPGMPIALTVSTERRVPRLRDDFVAYLLGDAALAVAVGAAAAVLRSPDGTVAAPRTVVSSAPVRWAVPAAWLAFGVWEWRRDQSRGYYSRAQSLAPTRLYHEFLTYPAAAWLAVGPVTEALTCRGGSRRARTVVAVASSVWVAGIVRDLGHPKLGHAPVSWRRGLPRPLARPWPVDSVTLAANAEARTR